MSLPYNGFSPAERERAGRIQTRAFRDGHPKPTACRACGYTHGVIAHLEDYDRPLEAILPLCGACHRVVHARFTQPDPFRLRWEAILAGRLPHMGGVRPTEDVLGDIDAGLYVPESRREAASR